MCTFCSFFELSAEKTCEYSRKNFGRSVEAPFSGSTRTLCKKTFPLEQLTIFRSVSDFEPKKLRFSMKPFQQSCQNCYVWFPRKTPRKYRSTEKTAILFIFFGVLTKKKTGIQQNCFGRAVKKAFLVSSKNLQKLNW